MRQALGLLASAALLFVVSGCGADQAGTPGGTVVDVSERDFAISAPERVSAGDLDLRVQNRGPDQHELIVARTTGHRPPLRSDGFTIDEEALGRAEAGALEPGAPGAVRDLHLQLAPGRYVLFCNMSGHYLGGMHRALVVTG